MRTLLRTTGSSGGPIALVQQDSEQQPDLTLLRPRPDFYSQSHPQPADVLLVVEVMDTSVERDRRLKLPLSARAGLTEVWLVDIPGARIDTFRQPEAAGYRGHCEVEILSANNWWKRDPDEVLRVCIERHQTVV